MVTIQSRRSGLTVKIDDVEYGALLAEHGEHGAYAHILSSLAVSRSDKEEDGVSLLLGAHSLEGLDVRAPEYVEGIKIAMEAIENNV